LIKYAVSANESRQVELVPRILSYLKHLPAYEWDDVILLKGNYSIKFLGESITHYAKLIGSTTPDIVTYNLVSGLLEIAYYRSEFTEKIHETLWNYGRCIINLMDSCSSKLVSFYESVEECLKI
jgi:phosphatidylinositol 4-kinase